MRPGAASGEQQQASPRAAEAQATPTEQTQSSAASAGVAGVEAPLRRRGALRPVASILIVLLVVGLAWKAAKLAGGEPWRYDSFLGTGIAFQHNPPLRILQLSDRQVPHLWDIGASSGCKRPPARG